MLKALGINDVYTIAVRHVDVHISSMICNLTSNNSEKKNV